MDFTLYWFMLPLSAFIATTAMLSGIGGAALFTPLFVIIFPLLGPQYPLESTIAAIGTALLTGTLGSLSGYIGYYRKRLIDFQITKKFLYTAVPVAIFGALVARYIDDALLLAGYSILVFILALAIMFLRQRSTQHSEDASSTRSISIKIDNTGKRYEYFAPKHGLASVSLTSIGAFLTGLLSVGIGEVIIAQLTKRDIPVPIAAATSIAIGTVTLAAASFVVLGQLISADGLSAVPWHLVIYTIPGVIIGGQIGPRLQGRIPQRALELTIGFVFIAISFAMMSIALK